MTRPAPAEGSRRGGARRTAGPVVRPHPAAPEPCRVANPLIGGVQAALTRTGPDPQVPPSFCVTLAHRSQANELVGRDVAVGFYGRGEGCRPEGPGLATPSSAGRPAPMGLPG